ncbi:MAG: DUF1097 domain-containing protein [Velocimicrobium sp.]
MKKYFGDYLGCLGIAMAIYAGIWMIACDKLGLISFAGFAGCTTYFASGKKNMAGIKTAAFTNVSGVFWGMAAILAGTYFAFPYSGAVYCAIISYFIIKQAEIAWFQFIPDAYVGCFITFACNGAWITVIISLLLGIVIGYITEITGTWIYNKFGNSSITTS